MLLCSLCQETAAVSLFQEVAMTTCCYDLLATMTLFPKLVMHNSLYISSASVTSLRSPSNTPAGTTRLLTDRNYLPHGQGCSLEPVLEEDNPCTWIKLAFIWPWFRVGGLSPWVCEMNSALDFCLKHSLLKDWRVLRESEQREMQHFLGVKQMFYWARGIKAFA